MAARAPARRGSRQWIFALGSYGYDWTNGEHRAELISFPEAMSRANYAGVESGTVAPPDHSSDFYYEDGDKDHSVWFLDVVSFLNELHVLRDQQAGGFAIYRLGTEDAAIWDGDQSSAAVVDHREGETAPPNSEGK